MKRGWSRLIKLSLLLFFLSFIFLFKNKIVSYFSPKTPQPFSQIKKEEITGLIIQSNKKTEIYKKNQAWYLKKDRQEFRADGERINKILDAVLAFKKEEIISKNRNKHKELGIQKQKIILKTKRQDYHLFIGNSAGINKNYVRVDNENEVFLAENLSDIFYPEDFRDLNVYFIKDETNVSYAEISYEDKKIVLEKKGNNWSSKWRIGNKTAKKDRVDFFLNDLKTLKAKDILPKNTSLPEIKPHLSIKIKENRQEKKGDFFEQDSNNYYLKLSTSDVIYQIAAPNVSSLKKEEKDFINE